MFWLSCLLLPKFRSRLRNMFMGYMKKACGQKKYFFFKKSYNFNNKNFCSLWNKSFEWLTWFLTASIWFDLASNSALYTVHVFSNSTIRLSKLSRSLQTNALKKGKNYLSFHKIYRKCYQHTEISQKSTTMTLDQCRKIVQHDTKIINLDTPNVDIISNS